MPDLNDAQLMDIVGDIYDCVLLPSRWAAAVATIQSRFGWHNAMLAVNSLDGHAGNYQIALGIPEHFQQLAVDPMMQPHVLAMWGGNERISAAPLGEPVLQSQLGSPEDWPENPFFRDFGMPQGLIDTVAIGLARDQRSVANLAGGRHVSKGPFTEQELDGLRLLAPHLRRAVAMARLFDDTMERASTFAAALDASPTAIIVVDGDLGVVHANAPALAMFEDGDPVLARSDRLKVTDEVAPGALAAIVAQCARGDLGGQFSGSAIPARRADRSPVLIHALPLQGGEIRPGIMRRAVAALFIAAAPGPLRLPGDALAALFDLTPAELRVMELVVQGLTLAEVGQRLGIARSTVKTHMERVFNKTGVTRREDLALLAMRLSAPR